MDALERIAVSVRVGKGVHLRDALLRHCVLIFCTITVGGRPLIKKQEVATVLIDEAAECHEAASLPVLRSDVERLIA